MIEILLGIIVLLLVAGIAVGAFAMLKLRSWFRRLARKNGQLGKTTRETAKGKANQRDTVLDHWFDHSAWPQIESLLAIYREIDGKDSLPMTRRWAASPDILRHLLRHIERRRPRTIVECSCGTSTVAMALLLRAREIDAHIYSIENHPRIASEARRELQGRGLESYVTIIDAPLTPRRYEGDEQDYNWYALQPGAVPDSIDMLVVDGPWGQVNARARYPAGPELFHRLTRDAHAFLDDASRGQERATVIRWRALYPDLGVRTFESEKGAVEMFFLDRKIEAYLPAFALAEPLRSATLAETAQASLPPSGPLSTP